MKSRLLSLLLFGVIGGVTEVVIIISLLLLLIRILASASVIEIAFLNVVDIKSTVTAQNIINYKSGIMFVATTALVVVVAVGCKNCILDLLSCCY